MAGDLSDLTGDLFPGDVDFGAWNQPTLDGSGKEERAMTAARSYYDYCFQSLEDDLNTLLPTDLLFEGIGEQEVVQRAQSDEMETEEPDVEQHLCTLTGEIVGAGYYSGSVSDNEMVSLIRNPDNIYDSNAIKVCNVAGEQVGHISRNLAKALAPLMDNKIARVEGVVPHGESEILTMTVELSFWGRPENKDETIRMLQKFGFYPLQAMSLSAEGLEAAAGSSSAFLPNASYVSSSRMELSPAEMKNQLDQLFENLQEGDKTSETDAAKAIATPLYQHQRQALNWMIQQESGNSLPPFWSETSNGRYFNSITGFATATRPSSVRGGILADDMGLGKTLEMIALIVTNFQDGEPLAEPVPGQVREMPARICETHDKDTGRRNLKRPRQRKARSLKPRRKRAKDSTDMDSVDSSDDLFVVTGDVEQSPDDGEVEQDQKAEMSWTESQEINANDDGATAANMLTRSDSIYSHFKLQSYAAAAKAVPAGLDQCPERPTRKAVKHCLSDSESNSENDSAEAASSTSSEGQDPGFASVISNQTTPQQSLADSWCISRGGDVCGGDVIAASPSSVTEQPVCNAVASGVPLASGSPFQIVTSSTGALEDSNVGTAGGVEDSNTSIVGTPEDSVAAESETVTTLEEVQQRSEETARLASNLIQAVGNAQSEVHRSNSEELRPGGINLAASTEVSAAGQLGCLHACDGEAVAAGAGFISWSRDSAEAVDRRGEWLPDDVFEFCGKRAKTKISEPLSAAKAEGTDTDQPVLAKLRSIPGPGKPDAGKKFDYLHTSTGEKEESRERGKGTGSQVFVPNPFEIDEDAVAAKPSEMLSSESGQLSNTESWQESTAPFGQNPRQPLKPQVGTSRCATIKPKKRLILKESTRKRLLTKCFSPRKKGVSAVIDGDDDSLPDLADPADDPTNDLDSAPTDWLTSKRSPKSKSKIPHKMQALCRKQSSASLLTSFPDCRPEDSVPDLLSQAVDIAELSDMKMALPSPSGVNTCEERTGRTLCTGPRTTLIVCPLSVLSNWQNQFEEHLDRCVHLEIYTYYGPGRTENADLLAQKDVVLTTYQTLGSDAKGSCTLQKVSWLRVVLDEAHTIRNPNAMQTKAVIQLQTERKWALTGTPIQNSIKDLYSLINFLAIPPFTEKVWWNRTIERPINTRSQQGLKRVSQLMRTIAMRRMKTTMVNGKLLVDLPQKTVFQETMKLSEEEQATYDTMQREGKLIVSRYFRQGTLLHNYGEVLAILMRLRQLCCHPFLVAKAAQAAADTLEKVAASQGINSGTTEEMRAALIEKILMVLTSGSEEECSICLEPLRGPAITHCAHLFCKNCIEQVIRTEEPPAHCPLCRSEVRLDQLVEVPPEQIEATEARGQESITNQDWQSSTKVDALMSALITLRNEDPTVKSLVVSQFTSFLTVVETPLRHSGFNFVRLDGSMSAGQRTAAIQAFSSSEPNSPTVFLLSLKAGGVGLNLVAASRVFLMEPAWNPASEEQCFDRCHRLGQTRDVIVTKFIVEDSVEERMLELQERKRQLMHGAFGQKKQTAEQRRAARISDIKNLMQIT